MSLGLKELTYRTRSLSANGRFLKRMALASEKTVALAPIPNASAVMATAVKPGFWARVRSPNRRSCHMSDETKLALRMFPQRAWQIGDLMQTASHSACQNEV